MMANSDKYEFIGCVYDREGSDLLVTASLESRNRIRYLLAPGTKEITTKEGKKINIKGFEMKESLIPGLKGEQVRDLNCYKPTEFFFQSVKGKFGDFYVSNKDAEGKSFLLFPKSDKKPDAKYAYYLSREKEAYVPKDEVPSSPYKVEELPESIQKQPKSPRTFA